MGRSLERLRSRGESVDVIELARQLLFLKSPAARTLARRIVAEVLGQPEKSLPDVLEARHLRPAQFRPGQFRPCQFRPCQLAAVADTPIRRVSFSVVDLETTGVALETSAIVEIGAVRVRRLRSTASFHSMVKPPHPVPPRICALTGIDDGMLANAPGATLALGRFRRWLGRTPTAPFVAHNASFDWRFVERALRDAGLPEYPGPILCTRRLAVRLLPDLGRYDLDQLCAQFGISNSARHRALGGDHARSPHRAARRRSRTRPLGSGDRRIGRGS